MAVTVGSQLGSYEITALLGKGGFGEVYRAKDKKLKREVAIKILPDEFSINPDRLTRFQREAEVLASLNHPNIAAIYDLGAQDQSQFLVLELVDGETLADRIARGPIPVEEALNIAKQICEAFEAAHEKGVIHRDLKPANVKLTPEGQVKVLDFGLAKAVSADAPASLMSNSPTLSLAATQAGVILGTAAYMSPEQAKGKPADRRADIWAFGVVMFETLTGKMLYSGETASETMAQVIMKDVDLNVLPTNTPACLRELLRRCLVKDPRNRMRDIGEARIALEETLSRPDAAPATSQPLLPDSVRTQPKWRRALPWMTTTVLAVSLILMLWQSLRRAPSVLSLMRVEMNLGIEGFLLTNQGPSAVLSPDGKMVALRVAKGVAVQIYLRRLDQLRAVALAGTENAQDPFFSPDSQWIGFFADGKLKKIPVAGGAALTVCDAPKGGGGSWSEDGSIVFSPNVNAPLFRVSSAGGTPEQLTKLENGEVVHQRPQILPPGRAVLFTAASHGDSNNANIVVQVLPGGERKIVQRGGYAARYLPSGHLVYMHQATLFAVPFDLDRLEVSGQAVPMLEGIIRNTISGGASDTGRAGAQISFSDTGAALYLSGADSRGDVGLYWMGRDGKFTLLRSTLADYYNPRFSPDGRRIAVNIAEQQNDIWIYEWERDAITRFTFDPTPDDNPAWTPDGKRIAFDSERGDKAIRNIYWQHSDGTGEVQRLTESTNPQRPSSFHPSGKFLAFAEETPNTRTDIMILPLDGDESSGWKPGKPYPFVAGPADEVEPEFSPDGRWIAYQSNESGGYEVYVRPFPGPGSKWQISTGGGLLPTWSRTGKQLFYRSTGNVKIMAVGYRVDGDSFVPDKPQLWSDGAFIDRGRNRNLDVHPDGQRFAVTKLPEATERLDHAILVLNFFDELRRIASSSKR